MRVAIYARVSTAGRIAIASCVSCGPSLDVSGEAVGTFKAMKNGAKH
jgi:hypothetical protein